MAQMRHRIWKVTWGAISPLQPPIPKHPLLSMSNKQYVGLLLHLKKKKNRKKHYVYCINAALNLSAEATVFLLPPTIIFIVLEHNKSGS